MSGRGRLIIFGAMTMVLTTTAIAEAGPIRAFAPGQITIPAGAPGTMEGPSDPYPSANPVSWCQGTIQDVDVHLNSFEHGATENLDILLVGPGGQNALVASDSGNTTDVGLLNITLDDEAASPLPAPWTDGTFQPTNVTGASDTMDPPAPAPSGGSALSVFDGTNPNGTWRLFIDDQVGGDTGFLDSWALTITVASTAPSSTGVCIPHTGTAEPYPTTTAISGLASPIQDVNVTLNGLTHTHGDDLDILLAGPGGRNAMLMSDAGGSTDLSGVNLTFDDEASGSLPDGTTPPLGTGTFKPGNYDGSLENLPAPAPSTQGISLATFRGLDPNGTWSLFVRDDAGGDFGLVNSWSLQLTTPSYSISPAKAKEGKKATFTVTRTGDIGQGVTATFATAPGTAKRKDFKALAGTLTFAAGDTTEQVVVKTKNDNKDEKRNEKFALNLTAGTVTFTGTGRIKDTDK